MDTEPGRCGDERGDGRRCTLGENHGGPHSFTAVMLTPAQAEMLARVANSNGQIYNCRSAEKATISALSRRGLLRRVQFAACPSDLVLAQVSQHGMRVLDMASA